MLSRLFRRITSRTTRKAACAPQCRTASPANDSLPFQAPPDLADLTEDELFRKLCATQLGDAGKVERLIGHENSELLDGNRRALMILALLRLRNDLR